MSIKLFDNPYSDCTVVKNAIFDHVMPTLSPNAWKVLCVAIRQTWGRSIIKQARLDYSQFIEKTGVKGKGSIANAIKECIEAGYLLRHEAEQDQEALYSLNIEFELGDAIPPTVTKVAPPEKEEPIEELIVEEEEIIIPEPEHEQAFYDLVDFAREVEAEIDMALIKEAVTLNDENAVFAWVETARAMSHLPRAARFDAALDRLLDQVPPLPILPFDLDEDEEAKAPETQPKFLDANELWVATLEGLESKVRKSKLSWLKPTRAIELSDNMLTIAAPTKRTKEWLEDGQLAAIIQETLNQVAGESIEINYIVRK